MSDMAKQARAAMKAKAKSLTTADPHQKVDSSTWTPSDALNADVKTGLRPISRRAFKAGGKVQGAAAKTNMGLKPRMGANKPITPDSMANKNMKSANEDRAGIKHIGALKTGGRAKKMMGGPMMGDGMMAPVMGTGGGGRGTGTMPQGIDANDPRFNDVPGKANVPYKKGGKVHDDVKEDMALIKKMVKPEARKARKEGGGVFSGPGYPGKVPGATGGRTAHARGGKAAKGKTNINIVIGAGKPGMGATPMGGPTPPPPGSDGAPPGGMPIPMPAPAAGAAAPAPMPVPFPVPMGGAGGAGPGPMPRKAGGRTYRSYKDMDAGAGSGLGRLEKTEIAEHKRGERKAGGRTYRSYKDMDAGAGSGLGRLEKTEIQAHKR
jgi:hypothetical protein